MENNVNIKNRMTAAAGALAIALTLAACGDSADTQIPGTQASPEQTAAGSNTVDADHNDADVMFAQMMIVHHQGAIEMADLAVEKASTQEVRTLGERISAAQGPEVDQMSSWLIVWGEDSAADADMEGMDHGGMDMGGMDMPAAMAELDELSGSEFDRAFLEMMTEHHNGAIEMAQTELDNGANPQALALADKIIEDQTAEIAEMAQMLQDL